MSFSQMWLYFIFGAILSICPSCAPVVPKEVHVEKATAKAGSVEIVGRVISRRGEVIPKTRVYIVMGKIPPWSPGPHLHRGLVTYTDFTDDLGLFRVKISSSSARRFRYFQLSYSPASPFFPIKGERQYSLSKEDNINVGDLVVQERTRKDARKLYMKILKIKEEDMNENDERFQEMIRSMKIKR